MALKSYNEIKENMRLDWSYNNVDGDNLTEFADSLTPVYYSEIIGEWSGLPMEKSDTWREHGHEITIESTIINLMAIDLFYYYLELVNKAFDEIKSEEED
jgi:hypothetical protein